MRTSELFLLFLFKFLHFLSCALWQSDNKLRSGCQMANNELLMSRPSRRCLDPRKKKSLSYLDLQNFQSENISHFIWNMLEDGGKGTSKPVQTLYISFSSRSSFFLFELRGVWLSARFLEDLSNTELRGLVHEAWWTATRWTLEVLQLGMSRKDVLVNLATNFGRSHATLAFLTFPSCKTKWSGWAASSGGFAAVPQQTGWAWQVGSYPLNVNDRFCSWAHPCNSWSSLKSCRYEGLEKCQIWSSLTSTRLPHRGIWTMRQRLMHVSLCLSFCQPSQWNVVTWCHVFTGFFRYRKLAKKMHPDKNGGTEAAKQRRSDWEDVGGFDNSIILYHFVALSAAAATVSLWRDVGGSMVQVPSHERAIWGFEEKTRRGQSSKLMAARFRGT